MWPGLLTSITITNSGFKRDGFLIHLVVWILIFLVIWLNTNNLLATYCFLKICYYGLSGRLSPIVYRLQAIRVGLCFLSMPVLRLGAIIKSIIKNESAKIGIGLFLCVFFYVLRTLYIIQRRSAKVQHYVSPSKAIQVSFYNVL